MSEGVNGGLYKKQDVWKDSIFGDCIMRLLLDVRGRHTMSTGKKFQCKHR
jgi:hypothetical protein